MRGYWITWGVLLVVTVAMLWADTATVPRLAFVVFMVATMLTKASIIGANFMHLRAESAGIVLTVVVGLIVTAVVLFVLIAPDATRIHEMVNHYGPR